MDPRFDDPLNKLVHELRNGICRLEGLNCEFLKIMLEQRATMRQMEKALTEYCEAVRETQNPKH